MSTIVWQLFGNIDSANLHLNSKENNIMWPYIIDGVLILILVISTIVGIVKGFFDSLLSLIGTGLAFAIAVFTAKYVSSFLNKILGIEEFVLKKLDATNEGTVEFFGVRTNSEVAKFCTWIVTVIVLFLIIKLAIYILSKIFESVTKNSPTLSGINRLLGMVFGLAKGVAYVAVILGLCSSVAEVPVIGTAITDKIADTKITSFAYKYVDDFVETQLTQEKIDEIIAKLAGSDSNADKDSSDESSDEADSGTDSGTDTGTGTDTSTGTDTGTEGGIPAGAESGTTSTDAD